MTAGWRLLGSAVLIVASAGCVGGPAPRDHFYRLEVSTPTRSGPTLPGVLEVARFTSDDVLRRTAILRAEPGSPEVMPYGYHFWVNSPTLILQHALVDYLRAAGAAETVTTPRAGMNADWNVSGQLYRFDHLPGPEPKVTVEIELGLEKGQRRNSKSVVQKIYRAEVSAADKSFRAAAEAFGNAVGTIFERFTADLRAAAP
ncbi:MAG: ABC-type transport auxiliary lipoprotein family protein [Myxococcota bacterium]|jgi:cholesterol transport system auxiliary component|nr:hypothetical protein [Deltaproteobacteria bacterium]MCP4239813.1 hypothetical protein [bacterium]MDP6074532.1 ABC-type transport auxiliary lipoprotein family protein [Myxococcota bacterium]MDP6244465.1 ABC-type transport auxiliary lipoprotein family protein [Myxococcota bacterium]MDP7073917.1 ABC-type transport auxiliary lipoprotein family protein [Myxococcota bacterium]